MIEVAIPSYNRPSQIQQKTLAFLRDGGFDLQKQVTIWVANKQQKKLYEESVDRSMYKEIRVARIGLTNAKNCIMRGYTKGTRVLSVDDDVTDLVHAISTKKVARVKDVHGFVKNAFDVTAKNGLYMWGIYPVPNAKWMYDARVEVSTGLTFLLGPFHGFIARPRNKNLRLTVQYKEDIEQSVLFYLEDGGVVRFNRYSIKTVFFASGGIGDEKSRIEKNETAVRQLVDKYPQYLAPRRRKNGFAEIRFKKV